MLFLGFMLLCNIKKYHIIVFSGSQTTTTTLKLCLDNKSLFVNKGSCDIVLWLWKFAELEQKWKWNNLKIVISFYVELLRFGMIFENKTHWKMKHFSIVLSQHMSKCFESLNNVEGFKFEGMRSRRSVKRSNVLNYATRFHDFNLFILLTESNGYLSSITPCNTLLLSSW